MKKNNVIIIAAVILLLVVGAFMVSDFYQGGNQDEKNLYEFNLDQLNTVDSSLIAYREVQQIKPEIEVLKAVTVDSKDRIFVTGQNKIIIYDATGKLLKDIPTQSVAFAICILENGEILTAERKQILFWDENGNLLDSLVMESEKSIITSIASSESSLFIADAGNKLVYHYDLYGNFINDIGRKDSIQGIEGFIIPSPFFDVAIGRDGELWAVNSGRHQLESYDADGNIKSSWKKTSMDIDGFSGCCNPSHIAILSNGSFVTSEKGLIRVKIHSPTGAFENVVAAPDQFEKGTKGLDIAVDSKDRIIIADPKKGMIRIFIKK